jgi:hypothetical protein
MLVNALRGHLAEFGITGGHGIANVKRFSSPGPIVANSITWFETGGQTIMQLDKDGNTTADLTIACRHWSSPTSETSSLDLPERDHLSCQSSPAIRFRASEPFFEPTWPRIHALGTVRNSRQTEVEQIASMFIPSRESRGVEGSGQGCGVSLRIFPACPAAVLPRPSVLRSYGSACAMPPTAVGQLLVYRVFLCQYWLTFGHFTYNKLASWSRVRAS